MNDECCKCCNKPNHLIGRQEWLNIQKRMLPGNFSESGFINEGESLEKIIDNDRIILEKRGITYDQIADQLENLDNIKDKYKVKIKSYFGRQECPFISELQECFCEDNYGSDDITVTNRKTGKSIKYSSLVPHMIRCHKFFESPSVSYRVDPLEIIEFFNLKPSEKYNSMTERDYYWKNDKCIENFDVLDIHRLKKILSELSVSTYTYDNINIYIVPTNESLESFIPEINEEKKYSYEKLRTLIYNFKTKNQISLLSKSSPKDIKRYNTTQKQLFQQELNDELMLYNLYKKYKLLIHPYKNLSMQAFVILDTSRNTSRNTSYNIYYDNTDDISNHIISDDIISDDISNHIISDDIISDDIISDDIISDDNLVYNIENIPLIIDNSCVLQTFKLYEQKHKYYPE